MKLSVRDDNSAYDAGLRTQCKVVKTDLEYKHERMEKNAFEFLRATNFRGSKRIRDIYPKLNDAPVILCVADAQ